MRPEYGQRPRNQVLSVTARSGMRVRYRRASWVLESWCRIPRVNDAAGNAGADGTAAAGDAAADGTVTADGAAAAFAQTVA
jgi:hypothetical protein